MNNIYCDTNKIRSCGYDIIKLANDFKSIVTNIVNKTNSTESEIFNKFYNELKSFGKMYEECADKIEESMLNNKYE